MKSSQYQWNLPTDIQEVGRTLEEVVGAGQRVPVRPRHNLGAVWSTLIGRGPSLLRSHCNALGENLSSDDCASNLMP